MKRYFTLIEILLTIALAGMAAGVIGIHFFKARKQQDFQSCVESLCKRLELAQTLALCCEIPLTVSIEHKDDKLIALAIFDQELPPGFKRILKSPLVLSGVENIYLNRQESLPITLTFKSEGYPRFPRSCLKLSCEKKSATIALLGYPSAVTISELCEEIDETPSYPQAILSSS